MGDLIFGGGVCERMTQATRLDRINEVLNQKLAKYKSECTIQEDDRELLVRQLVAIKKENARLRREIEKIKSVRVFSRYTPGVSHLCRMPRRRAFTYSIS